ncbi:MAG TPA: aspartate aminotransferase family protein [Bacteroidia bacterium]|nr:aspartate aminotransferase family protein [Bacteroidia bacterium]
MSTNRELFLRHVAQTSPSPIGIEIERAEGVFLFGPNGEKYIDLISGISVSNVGHCHPKVVEATKAQIDKYMHLMVYGEYIQSPQVKLAEKITSLLPANLDAVFFTNSGAEAIEGAMKLAKRVTGRYEVISFRNAYHGSTQGALSIMGSEFFKNSFRPLIPGTRLLDYNVSSQLQEITTETACVIVEPLQAEAGAVVPSNEFMIALRKRCTETKTFLIFDEVQTGFGRTGNLFGFEASGAVPDVIVFAKGMGGGMPIGAFVSSRENMNALTHHPVLGHSTTFGGHPVSCAASLATIETIIAEKLHGQAADKEKIIRRILVHPTIREIRGKGLMLAIVFDNFDQIKKIIDAALAKGVIIDWFLFCDHAIRIAPPLNIPEDVLEDACKTIVEAIDESR